MSNAHPNQRSPRLDQDAVRHRFNEAADLLTGRHDPLEWRVGRWRDLISAKALYSATVQRWFNVASIPKAGPGPRQRIQGREAERLVASIRAQGARLAVPGVVDLSDLAAEATGVAKVVLESIQDMLLKLALQIARDDYEDRRERQRQGVELAKSAGRFTGRKANTKVHDRIVALRTAGHSIPETARLAGCSESQVKRVWALNKA